MHRTSGKIRPTLAMTLAAAMVLATAVIAQQTQQSSSESKSSNGQATASSSASATSSSRGGQISSAGPNLPTFAVWYSWKSAPTKAEDQTASNDHTHYMANLAKNNTLVLEGRFADATGAMAVIQARDGDEALRIVRNEPAVVNGKLEFILKEWQPRFGIIGRTAAMPIKAIGR